MTVGQLTIIELELKKCERTYSGFPCEAEVGVTGDAPCYNCRATCQDLDALAEGDAVVRFAKPSAFLPFDLDAIPNVQSVSYAPPELDLGGGLGVRASVTVTFKDHRSPDTDKSGDRYLDTRDYDPYERGTYFGKLRARYPFLQGQTLRWIQGTSDQPLETMETRTFIVDAVTGPTIDGTFTITAKDVLRLTDGDQSVAPLVGTDTSAASFGPAYLGTIATVPVGTPLAAASGKVVIAGQEVASFTTAYAGPLVRLLSLTGRGLHGTTPVDNSGGDEINLQVLLEYEPQSPADILYDLLVNYAGVPASFIARGDWQTEAATYINRNYSGRVGTPTAVKTLITELITQTASSMWWDNAAQLLRWQVLKRPSLGSAVYDDRVTAPGSVNIQDEYSKRVSRCLVYIGQRNPLINLDNVDNYAATVLRQEITTEPEFGGVPAYRTIFSRWITSEARNTAERLGDLILQRFSRPPRQVGFTLPRAAGATVPELGGAYTMGALMLQDPTGAPTTIPIQVSSVTPGETAYTVRAEEITYSEVIVPEDPNVVPVSISDNDTNISLRDKYNSAGGPTPTADTVVNVTVTTGTVLGSLDTATPAVTLGDWPAGVTINLYNHGWIVGRGGVGGRGPTWSLVVLAATFGGGLSGSLKGLAGTDGGDGGLAFDANFPAAITVNLYNYGVIGGGGGGGGAGSAMASYFRFTNVTSTEPNVSYWGYSAGGAGGGGAGYLGGNGGNVSAIGSVQATAGGVAPDGYTAPSAALAGAIEEGSAGSVAGFSTTYKLWRHASGISEVVSMVARGGFGGAGGDLGQPGDGGGDYALRPAAGTYNAGQTDEYTVYARNGNTRTGGENPYATAGGAAGPAIVQTGGTINIIEAGDIRGVIL